MRAPSLTITAAARIAYLLIIVGATLTRLRLDFDVGLAVERLQAALNPTFVPRDVVDAARNFVLFAGWGAVWMITAPGTRLLRSALVAAVLGALISVGVETVQLFSPVREASILDVITNSTGALAGALTIVIVIMVLAAQRGRRSFVGMPAIAFAGAYGAAVLLEALIPLFRQDRVPRAWGGPGSRLALAVEYLRTEPLTQLPVMDVFLFAPAGGFLVAALVEGGLRYRSAAIVAVLSAPPVFATVQLLRAIFGMPIESGAVVVHSLSIAGGALLAAAALPTLTSRLRGRHRPLVLLAFYVALMALWSWRPYLPTTGVVTIIAQLRVERLIPLYSLYFRGDLFSATTVAVQFLLFVPLGALLAVWPLRRRGPFAHLLPAIYLAVVLETGQMLVLIRFFDITDVILQCAGAAVAWLLVRRTGYPVYGEIAAAPLRRRAAGGVRGAEGVAD